MKTVSSIFSSEYRIKSSEFLGFLCPASSISEAEHHLDTLRKKHPSASHHCFAYIMNPSEPVEYCSDDGEPGGTAGLPILNCLKAHNLINVILIVVRYYGGTKLGKAGLIDAYQQTSNKVIDQSKIKILHAIKVYEIEYPYSLQSLIDAWQRRFNWIELKSSYLETVTLKVGCPVFESQEFESEVSAYKHQLIKFHPLDNSFHIQD